MNQRVQKKTGIVLSYKSIYKIYKAIEKEKTKSLQLQETKENRQNDFYHKILQINGISLILKSKVVNYEKVKEKSEKNRKKKREFTINPFKKQLYKLHKNNLKDILIEQKTL